MNDIAEIVHGCSCAYYGMANKNVRTHAQTDVMT